MWIGAFRFSGDTAGQRRHSQYAVRNLCSAAGPRDKASPEDSPRHVGCRYWSLIPSACSSSSLLDLLWCVFRLRGPHHHPPRSSLPSPEALIQRPPTAAEIYANAAFAQPQHTSQSLMPLAKAVRPGRDIIARAARSEARAGHSVGGCRRPFRRVASPCDDRDPRYQQRLSRSISRLSPLAKASNRCSLQRSSKSATRLRLELQRRDLRVPGLSLGRARQDPKSPRSPGSIALPSPRI